MFNIQEAIAQAAAQGPNMTEAQQGGGGDFQPPAAGLVRLRLIGYVELGKHEDEYKGEKKLRDKVVLTFELSGPKHPVQENGEPHRISVTETLSLNEKANFYRLFHRLNYDKTATHFAQLLGKDFLGTIVHRTTGEGEKARTYANLKDESGYTIRPPFIEDAETGETRRVVVDEPKSPLRLFLWNFATKPMWDSLFIDGNYPDRKDDKGNVIPNSGASKNYFQNRIKSALNWNGSPMAEILFAGGEPNLPDPETPARQDAGEEDPLAGAN